MSPQEGKTKTAPEEERSSDSAGQTTGASFELSPAAQAAVEAELSRYPERRTALIPILWIIQDEKGYVSNDGVVYAAEAVGISPAHVLEVLTFYTMFKRKPGGKYLLQVCRTLSCHMAGAGSLIDHLKKRLGIEIGEVTEDGLFEIMPVECLAACGMGPMMQINDEFVENLTEEKVDAILDHLRNGGELEAQPGPIVFPDAQRGDESTRPLTANFGMPESHRLEVYEKTGGYEALKKALSMDPGDLIEEVKSSGLRGRGGAGFPTGVKWGFVPKNLGKPVYLCINADESEPGTFKDRALLELDPHRVIEGMAIAAWALGSKTVFIYLRGEFGPQKVIFEKALEEAKKKGYVGRGICGSDFDFEILTFRGAGAYICGEETALLESLEGKKGFPRLKPPFPAVVGLYGCPTIVNNVETVAALPYILNRGAQAYRGLGTEKSPGTKMFSVSGPVKRPGVFEVELGYPLMDLIENECGGLVEGSELKAIIPGGSSVPILTAEECKDARLDYESLASLGTMLGSGGVIVIDRSLNMVQGLKNLAQFYSHESCGQCSPCREGTGWMHRTLTKIQGGQGTDRDVDLVNSLAKNMRGATICPLADALAMPAESFYQRYEDEFRAAVSQNSTGDRNDG